MCWIRGPKDFDSIATAKTALARGISVAPGPVFSATNSFRNFAGLNLSFEWNEPTEQKLRPLGKLLLS